MIRSMVSSDCNQIAVIEAQTFDTALDHHHLLALLKNPVFCGFVDDLSETDLVCNRQPILAGYLLANIVANEAEILSIAVSANYRSSGRGAALLEYFYTFLAGKNVKTVVLEVASDNNIAFALYCSRGFSEFGRRAGYYKRSDNRCDAIKMKLHVQDAFS